jgi:putative DNA methylase
MCLHRDLYTPRQLTALLFLSDAVRSILTEVAADAAKTGLSETDAQEYAKTICTFLALAVDRTADFNNSLCRWSPSNQKVMNLFGRSAIPMIWDFAEANTMGDSVGAWSTCVDYVGDCVEVLAAGKALYGNVKQHDAAQTADEMQLMVSTDPPYYDNVPYADLADFFYVWLRRTVGDLHRPLCDTVLVPKMSELTASPERFDGDKKKAKEHFESGFRRTFTQLRERLDPRFPLTVYYAFKQEDEESGGDESEATNGGVDLTTGWETLLAALISSGFAITATWPVRASQAWRMRSMGSNALASYIVLACRPRTEETRTGRAAFVAELKRELPIALRHLQQGNVAPVDFAQAAIGPGMAVFSRYSAVVESNGKPMSVRTALALINIIKDELLGEAVEELDRDTRWAVTWFSEHAFDLGEAGKANLLANAQATAVNALVAAGIVEVKGNQVRLFRPDELPADWDPTTDKRLTVWEMTHHLIRVYAHEKKGEVATAELLRKLGSKAEVARDLAYKLFTVCESKKRSQEAQPYNALVMGWPELARLSRETVRTDTTESRLPGME